MLYRYGRSLARSLLSAPFICAALATTSQCLFIARPVQAQIYSDVPTLMFSEDYNNFGDPAPGAFTHFTTTATNTSLANSVGLSLTGDWDYKLPRSPGLGFVRVDGFLTFSVGNVPVEVSDLVVSTHAKWVNGGGNSSTRTTSEARLEFYERLNPDDHTGPSIARFVQDTASLTGNGYQIVGPIVTPGSLNGGVTPGGGVFVLSANTDYMLALSLVTFVGNVTFDPLYTPTVSITNEFGGDLGDSFAGFETRFSWHTVPEPAAISLLLFGALALGATHVWQARRTAASCSSLVTD